MKILGIETTCDETSASVVEDGSRVLSNVVASSAELYRKYGGVVPEIAAREQVAFMIPVLREALSGVKNVDALAVSYGPGLIGSLLVGVECAKALALALSKPLVPVDHLIAHIYANWLNSKPKFPLVALIVSGGHTDLILMKAHGEFKWLGGTLDDAVGEAFDKVASALGLGYPGGPQIQKAAYEGDESKYDFPRPMLAGGDFNFSFSGLKTAVANSIKENGMIDTKSIAASFQLAAVDVLARKTLDAARNFAVKEVLVGGGVAANELLRSKLVIELAKSRINVKFPEKVYAVDNGAMVATCAFYNFHPKKLEIVNADPGLYFS